MEFKKYDDPNEFVKDNEKFILEKEVSQIFAKEFCKIAGKEPKVRFEMRILVLEKLNAI